MNDQKETRVKAPNRKPLTPAQIIKRQALKLNRRIDCAGGCGAKVKTSLKICRKCRRKSDVMIKRIQFKGTRGSRKRKALVNKQGA